jgi:hypothetical protein
MTLQYNPNIITWHDFRRQFTQNYYKVLQQFIVFHNWMFIQCLLQQMVADSLGRHSTTDSLHSH